MSAWVQTSAAERSLTEAALLSREIEPGDWASFLAAFRRQHHRWLTTLVVADRQLYDAHPEGATAPSHRLVTEMPLSGARLFELSDGGGDAPRSAADTGRPGGVEIVVGDEPQCVVHRISDPLCIQLQTTVSGAHAGLRIDSGDGTTTLLRFRVPARPEVCDAMV